MSEMISLLPSNDKNDVVKIGRSSIQPKPSTSEPIATDTKANEFSDTEKEHGGYPMTGIGYHLYPFKGISTDRKYLSTHSEGTKIDLWPSDDESGRQKWIATEINDKTYTFTPWDGIYNDLKYLSVHSSGEKMDLYHIDDKSGRQQWIFNKISQTSGHLPIFNIWPANGISSDTDRKYLSVNHEGTKCDLWNIDDDSGRQQWILEPLDMELISIEFNIDAGEILQQNPEELCQQILRNETPTEQTMKFTIQESVSNTSSFSYEGGFSIWGQYDIEAGFPCVVSTKLSIGASTTHIFTTSSSTTETTTYTHEFPVVVPGNATYKAQAVIFRSLMDVPYDAVFKSKQTGATSKQSGIWSGTSTSTVFYWISEV